MYLDNVNMCLDMSMSIHIWTMSQSVYTMTRHVFTYLDISKQWLDISVMPVIPMYSLDHNEKNEVKNDFFSYVMPLVPALLSCDAKCTINGTILLIRWRHLKQGMTWFLWFCDAFGTSASITWHWWHCQWHHFVCQAKMIETRYNMTFWSSNTSVGIK